MSETRRSRTPVPQVLSGVARLLTRRAMVGWLLKTLGIVIAAIVPLATISAYFSVTPEQRGRLYLAGAILTGMALLMVRLGRALRSST